MRNVSLSVLQNRVGDELLRQLSGLGGRHAPCDHVAAEDIEDDVEVVVLAALGALQLGDVSSSIGSVLWPRARASSSLDGVACGVVL
jgi:hypothetical protein